MRLTGGGRLRVGRAGACSRTCRRTIPAAALAATAHVSRVSNPARTRPRQQQVSMTQKASTAGVTCLRSMQACGGPHHFSLSRAARAAFFTPVG